MSSLEQGATQSFVGQEHMLAAIRESASANDEGGSTPVMDEDGPSSSQPMVSESTATRPPKENAVDFLTSIMTSKTVTPHKTSESEASWNNWEAMEGRNVPHFIPPPPRPPFPGSSVAVSPPEMTSSPSFVTQNSAQMRFRGAPPFQDGGGMNNNMAAFTDQSPARGMRNQFNEFPHGQSQSGTSPTATPSFPRFPPPPRPPTDLGFFPGNSSNDTSPPFTPDSTFTRPPMFNSGIRTGNPEWQQH